MTKATKAKATECDLHGLAPCATCTKATKATKDEREDLALATEPVALTLAKATATLAPTSARYGARAVLAPTNATAEQVAKASGMTFADPGATFGTTKVPKVATVQVGRPRAKGRAKVDVALEQALKDGVAVGREGQALVTFDGREYTARVRVRVQRSGAWYVSASVRPGAPKATKATTRVASADVEGNPFA